MLALATGWDTGQLRGIWMSGRFADPIPTDTETPSALAAYCRANPAVPLASAIPALSAG